MNTFKSYKVIHMAASEMEQYLRQLYQLGVEVATEHGFKTTFVVQREDTESPAKSGYSIQRPLDTSKVSLQDSDLGMQSWRVAHLTPYMISPETGDLLLPEGQFDRFRLDIGAVLTNAIESPVTSVGIALGMTYPRNLEDPFELDMLLLSIQDRTLASCNESLVARMAEIFHLLPTKTELRGEATHIKTFCMEKQLIVDSADTKLVPGMISALHPSNKVTRAIRGIFEENFNNFIKRRRLHDLGID